MADTLRNYDSKGIIISLGPVLIESGFADGEFLTIEEDSDATVDVVGTDGEVAVSPTNDQRATVTVKLMSTAAANDGLSTLANLARTTPNMIGAVQPLLIKDSFGRALYTGANAWVQKAPSVSYDRPATTREWTIRVAHLVRFDGGN